MGVPKFYRWLSERYPQINQMISDNSLLPEIDNFYLDMNGIIHACTHPNDDSTASTLSLREMMLAIFRYIDRMVTEIAKPRKLLFMAIDGVAPRAKLNQQRARRFRAAQDRIEHVAKARARGEVVDEDAIFDSNCITPGTEFMELVGKHLRWFIRKKIKEDSLWRNLEIVFSGHDVPGEGEHKIMQYIREARARPDYAPNQRHCMYGQDADLIMLGLATHEPHFTLLREVVDFNAGRNRGGPARQTVIRQTREAQFQLMHLSILREYIELDLALGCEWPLDKERLCDDFIFLTFLVGNDFLPHLPTLDIGEHAFDVIFCAYKQVLGEKGNEGYIVQNGEISDLPRLERLFAIIGAQEQDILKNREEEAVAYNAKRRKFKDAGPMASEEEMEEAEEERQRAFEEAIQEALFGSSSAVQESVAEEIKETVIDEDEFLNGEFVSAVKKSRVQTKPSVAPVEGAKDYRGRYYYEKFKVLPGTPQSATFFQNLQESYLQGLMWCLAYYVKGCISWTWYFPYHYGPMLQDMTDLLAVSSHIQFDIGQPFRPFQQLLGCLPPPSKALLPRVYQFLMISDDSPILEYYPLDFGIDQDGKKNPWEAVVLLDFIDERRLMAAEAQFCREELLSTEEKARNTFGKVLSFLYDPNASETYFSCNPEIGLPDVNNCQSVVSESYPNLAPGAYFKPELIPGTTSPLAGFPTLGTLRMQNVETDFFKLNVFGSESKYRSIVLELEETALDASKVDCRILLGRVIYVNYPQMHEARIVSVSTEVEEHRLVYSLVDASTATASATTTTSTAVNGVGKSKDKPNGDGAVAGAKDTATTTTAADATMTTTQQPKVEIVTTKHDAVTRQKWAADAAEEAEKYHKGRGTPGSGGLNIGEVKIRLRVCPLQGMRRDPITGASKKVYGTDEADVPIQLALWSAAAIDPRFQETQSLSVEKLLPHGCEVLGVTGQLKGLRGKIVGPHGPETQEKGQQQRANSLKKQQENNEENKSTAAAAAASGPTPAKRTVDVEFSIFPQEPPFGHLIAESIGEDYFSSRDCCRSLMISPSVLGKIVGMILVEPGRMDFGLNLKRNGQYQLLGYVRSVNAVESLNAPSSAATMRGNAALALGSGSWGRGDAVKIVGSADTAEALAKRAEQEVSQWEYSARAIALLFDYKSRYPLLFENLESLPHQKRYAASELLLPRTAHQGHVTASALQTAAAAAAASLTDWMKAQPFFGMPRTPLTTISLSKDAMKAIERASDVRTSYLAACGPTLTVIKKVPVENLYRGNITTPSDAPASYNGPEAPRLGDRVVNLHATGVPFGLKGTVVAIHSNTGYVEAIFDEEFVGGRGLQGQCSQFRGRLCAWSTLLRVSGIAPKREATHSATNRITTAAGARAQAQVKQAPTSSASGVSDEDKQRRARELLLRTLGAGAAPAKEQVPAAPVAPSSSGSAAVGNKLLQALQQGQGVVSSSPPAASTTAATSTNSNKSSANTVAASALMKMLGGASTAPTAHPSSDEGAATEGVSEGKALDEQEFQGQGPAEGDEQQQALGVGPAIQPLHPMHHHPMGLGFPPPYPPMFMPPMPMLDPMTGMMMMPPPPQHPMMMMMPPFPPFGMMPPMHPGFQQAGMHMGVPGGGFVPPAGGPGPGPAGGGLTPSPNEIIKAKREAKMRAQLALQEEEERREAAATGGDAAAASALPDLTAELPPEKASAKSDGSGWAALMKAATSGDGGIGSDASASTANETKASNSSGASKAAADTMADPREGGIVTGGGAISGVGSSAGGYMAGAFPMPVAPPITMIPMAMAMNMGMPMGGGVGQQQQQQQPMSATPTGPRRQGQAGHGQSQGQGQGQGQYGKVKVMSRNSNTSPSKSSNTTTPPSSSTAATTTQPPQNKGPKGEGKPRSSTTPASTAIAAAKTSSTPTPPVTKAKTETTQTAKVTVAAPVPVPVSAAEGVQGKDKEEKPLTLAEKLLRAKQALQGRTQQGQGLGAETATAPLSNSSSNANAVPVSVPDTAAVAVVAVAAAVEIKPVANTDAPAASSTGFFSSAGSALMKMLGGGSSSNTSAGDGSETK